MKSSSSLSLAQLFVAATLGVGLAVTVTLHVLMESSRTTILARSEAERAAAAREVGDRVAGELAAATDTLDRVGQAVRYGTLRVEDPVAVEGRLLSELLARPDISDVTLTHADLRGHAPDGSAILGAEGRWQISVFRRSADPASALVTRTVTPSRAGFVTSLRPRQARGTLESVELVPEGVASDPTAHPTFATTVSAQSYGRAIWSDLSFSDLDTGRAEDRRVVVTVQRAIEDTGGHFAGVVRVGLLTRVIDALPRSMSGEAQQVFLCDDQGRLVARPDPSDTMALMGDDLRVSASHLRPEVRAALASASLESLARDRPERSERIIAGGVPYLATFRRIAPSQGWIAGIVVPEGVYTRDLERLRDRGFAAIVAVTFIVLVAGGLVLVELRRSLRSALASAARMRMFDFSPSPADARAKLREVAEVLDGVERAKTSLRALGKYVPIDLVRQLYAANREPELGGELVELSILFSDIEGFTTLSERLAPDALARALGHYLRAMTSGVRSTQGTVDKFIGDAVMAFWNAPERVADHSSRACAAILACMRQTQALYASADWQGLPPLFTRFGLHRARVMVGHFGSEERMSYTALGDGVNLASRLEGLCKHYGVACLASESVVEAVGSAFVFRLIDKVAVKGKHEAVRVYELLGAASDPGAEARAQGPYARALDAYFNRAFADALRALETSTDDPPSRVLAERCRVLRDAPPPPDWDGVYIATTK